MSVPPSSSRDDRPVNRVDFRERLATADQHGRRRWLYPRKPSGRWYRWRTVVGAVLIAIMFLGPFVRIGGNPLLLFNIVERKFSILGQIFWPADGIIFTVAMLIFFVGIMVFTSAFGRLWCGWTCPQTVMMEMVFRRIEYLIEGDSHQQRALDAAPWSRSKLMRKGAKHLLFLGLSFIIGNTLLAYVIGTEPLFEIITDPPREHWVGLTFMILFTLLFYGIFARFREQACTFICPYGRFQSALVDENTMVVAYDYRRGEKRAPWKRGQPVEERTAGGLGDCVNCHQCVAVCPTGIDIRNGIQMECVNCTACIDACDAVMDKVGRPRGLIRYASLNGIEQGKPLRFTARMKLYATLLAGLIAFFLVLVFTRAGVETMFLRAPGAMFQTMADGRISNLYTVKVMNKTGRDLPVEFRLENSDGQIVVMGAPVFVVPKEQLRQATVLVELDPSRLAGPNTPLTIGVYSANRRLETVRTSFVGPR